MKAFEKNIPALLLFLLLAGFAQTAAQRLIINHVNLITMTDSLVKKNYAVIIEKDTITAFLPAAAVKIRKTDKVMEGNNGYLLPGLFESHCHMGYLNYDFLRDFLSYGITSIRIPAGNETNRAWRDLINNDLLVGPDLYVAAPLIDGQPPAWGDQHSGPIVTNPDSAEYVVNELMANRYDMIKVYMRLQPDVYKKILQLCFEKKILVSGHIPIQMLRKDILSPYTGAIEHLSGYPRLLYREAEFSEEIKSKRFDGTMDQLASLDPDLSKLDSVARKTAEYNIWNCPTQVMYELKIDSLAVARINTPQLKEKYPGLFSYWNKVHQTPDSNYLKFVALKRATIFALQRNGAKLMAGTDAPNPWLLPGLSLHQELQYFVKCGLTPYQALVTATVNPAAYLGLEKKKGRIKPGYTADLLLLEKNPLDDISNTLSIKMVFKKGRLMNVSPIP